MSIEVNVIPLITEDTAAFIDYCVKYGPEHDESYIPDRKYQPREDEPVYILKSKEGTISGAASLMLHKNLRDLNRGRFRIFHCIENTEQNYRLLLDRVLEHTQGIENIHCFIPEERTEVIRTWVSLGFAIERFSFVLRKELISKEYADLPEGFTLNVFQPGKDNDAWCEIINASFARIAGHTQMTPERTDELRNRPDHLDEGMLILRSGNRPAGLINLEKISENGNDMLYIDVIAVHPDYQGNGLGRILLRFSNNFAIENGWKTSILTVNAENDKAVELYLREGFKKQNVFVCYNLRLT